MAVVLSSSEENNYFSQGALHRSHSGKFNASHHSYSSQLPPKSRSSNNFNTIISPSASPYSSAPSSPDTLHADSIAPSYTATPASTLSLDSSCNDEDDEDQIVFPSYDDYYGQAEDLEPPASPRGTGDSYTVSPTNSTSTSASRPESPEPIEHAEDDTAVRNLPTRHVDYLSHSWKEEDIWNSWKHIVSKRGAYSNSARLENASWRQWIKSKNKLKTISPENLNWLKDCDVTWLYGPLQTGSDKSYHLSAQSPVGSRISKSNSFLHKKPILKKRSMSEMMLQRSLSASSLVKQAAAAVQAQQLDRRPGAGLRAQSDYVAYPFSTRRMSRENTSVFPSISSSGLSSPWQGEKKHIHFNESVEQCIALDMKGDEDEEIDPYPIHEEYDSDSDDGAIMMKTSASKRKLPAMRKSAAPQNTTESKTIAMLPSTTLKYREDTPEPTESAMKHSGYWSNAKLSPSPSQETLRPSKPSSRILLGDDDEDDDMDMDWQPNAFLNRKDSMSVTQDRMSALHRTGSTGSLNGEPSGMRRTPSGMFMPISDSDEEDAAVSEGLFGKIVDTVNTARDIAHVLYNVGWRR